MHALIDNMLDSRKRLNSAIRDERCASDQLAIQTERWIETRPDRLARPLVEYRRARLALVDAQKADIRAQAVAAAAGLLCATCRAISPSHDAGCEDAWS